MPQLGHRELIVLIQLVESLDSEMQIVNGNRYTLGTQMFSSELKNLACKTKLYLDSFRSNPKANDPVWSAMYWAGLGTFIAVWKGLHQVAKPIQDAHSLTIPYAFVEWMTSRVRTLKGYEGTEIALFSCSKFEFVQYSTEGLRRLWKRLQESIPDVAELSPKLAVLGLPYSQGNNLARSALLAHELGHFVFQSESGFQLQESLLNELRKPLFSNMSDFKITPKFDEGRIAAECSRVLSYWLEECLCDLFAVWMVGPLFSYSFLEFISISGPQRPQDGLSLEFFESHPSDLFRLRLQFEFAGKLGWADSVAPECYKPLVDSIQASTKPEYVNSGLDDEALNRVYELCRQRFVEWSPKLVEALIAFLPVENSGARIALNEEAAIFKYLSRGVVPSTIRLDGTTVYPAGISLINAGYNFVVSNLHQLIERLPEADSKSDLTRAVWASRVESWIMKALEDHLLLRHVSP